MGAPQQTDALLIFRVGPVHCCAPTGPVEAIVVSPSLTHPPGISAAEPGIFRHNGRVVRVIDLRERFGIDKALRDPVGRVIIVDLETGRMGYRVDAIGDVLPVPAEGWSALPPQIPREVFTQALVIKGHITLLTDFERMRNLRSGHLQIRIGRMGREREQPGADDGSEIAQRTRLSARPRPPAHERPAIRQPAPDPAPRPSRSAYANRTVPADRCVANPGASSGASGRRGSSGCGSTVRESDAPGGERRHSPVGASGSWASAGFAAPTGRGSPPTKRPPPARDSKIASRYGDGPKGHPTRPVRTPGTSTLLDSWPLWSAALLMVGFAGWIYIVAFGGAPVATATGTGEMVTRPHSEPIRSMPEAEPSRLAEQRSTSPSHATESTLGDREGSAMPRGSPTAEGDLPVVSRPPAPAGAATVTVSRDAEGLVIEIRNLDIEAVVPAGTDLDESRYGPVAPTAAPDPHQSQSVADEAVSGGNGASAAESGMASGDVGALPRFSTKIDETRISADTVADYSVQPTRQAPRRYVIVHTVIEGDTLWQIAARYLRDPFRYPELARLSLIRDPDLIYPGDKVKIVRIVE